MDKNIRLLTDYPKNMRNMDRPPKRLYVRGELPDQSTQKFLCVVGSRHPTRYGREACASLIKGLSGYPISIVSGLAIGIDGLSHEAALEAGLHCIGFPGSGLEWDVLYPGSNRPLAKKIIEAGGALIAEFKPHYSMKNWMFPVRNRHMAGLSDAIVIIEGAHGSGTLKTAEYGLELNRDMMGVVGSIFSENSYGPHLLIRDGATPVFSSEDILRTLGFTPRSVSKPIRDISALDPVSHRIISALQREPLTLDELSDQLKIGASEMNIQLSALELEDWIKIEGTLISLC